MRSAPVNGAPAPGPLHETGPGTSAGAVPSTGPAVVELAPLEYAVRARTARDRWLPTAAADGEFGLLLLRRHTVLAALRQRRRPPQPESARTLELTAKVEHLERALATRTVIGQASGILIERHNIPADDAFRMLVTASSVTNRKLRDIAADLVHTGELPGPPDEPSPDL